MGIREGKTSEQFVADLLAEKGAQGALHYCLGWIDSLEEKREKLRQANELLLLTINEIKRTQEEASRRGGLSKSEAKLRAARENGKKGGRPRKEQ